MEETRPIFGQGWSVVNKQQAAKNIRQTKETRMEITEIAVHPPRYNRRFAGRAWRAAFSDRITFESSRQAGRKNSFRKFTGLGVK